MIHLRNQKTAAQGVGALNGSGEEQHVESHDRATGHRRASAVVSRAVAKAAEELELERIDLTLPSQGRATMNAHVPDLQFIARALGGKVNGAEVLAPGPNHSPKDRSLSVKPDSSSPDGFAGPFLCG